MSQESTQTPLLFGLREQSSQAVTEQYFGTDTELDQKDGPGEPIPQPR